jgi:type II secretory pathway pseudopilin PulG
MKTPPRPTMKRRTKRVLAALAVVGVLTALLFGSVTTADARPMNHEQAVRAAKEYLQTQAFSLKGLISQLKFDGYSKSDATYGAKHSGANWMKQAVRAAKEYLQTQAFSFSGMVEQLQFDGYTHAQAVHGARAVRL